MASLACLTYVVGFPYLAYLTFYTESTMMQPLIAAAATGKQRHDQQHAEHHNRPNNQLEDKSYTRSNRHASDNKHYLPDKHHDDN